MHSKTGRLTQEGKAIWLKPAIFIGLRGTIVQEISRGQNSVEKRVMIGFVQIP
jgi:hypothetical protein